LFINSFKKNIFLEGEGSAVADEDDEH